MTTCHTLPRCLCAERMASVSQCRAAGRRWRAGAIAALQMPAFTGTRYQSKERLHALALTRNGFVPVVPVTEDKLRTEKPNEINGVPVVPVVPVQNTTPRSKSPADALSPCPVAGCWCWCCWPGTSRGRGFKSLQPVCLRPHVDSGLHNREMGKGHPPIKVLPSDSRVRV